MPQSRGLGVVLLSEKSAQLGDVHTVERECSGARRAAQLGRRLKTKGKGTRPGGGGCPSLCRYNA